MLNGLIFNSGVSVENKTIIPIKGMHCRSCELLVESKLKKLNGITSVTVSFKNGTAKIFHKNNLNMNSVNQAIESCGYSIGNKSKLPWVTSNIKTYHHIIFSVAIILAILILWRTLGLSTNFSFGSPSNLFVVLLIGLTAGISTCMALVGGLILGVTARYAEKHPNNTPLQKFRPHLFFNLGRVISYILFGGLVGLVGSALQFNGITLGIMTIMVGLVMLTLGMQLTELFPRLSNISLTLPSGLSKLLGINKRQAEYSHKSSVILGALTFFLPCGFTQAMQLYAMSAGSMAKGALIMGIFAIGTAPGLLGVGGLSSIVKGKGTSFFFKFVGVAVIVLALVNISNGYNLTGWKGITFTQNLASNTKNVLYEDGIQIMRMDQNANGYTPNDFVVKQNIPVRWIITGKDSSSCSNSLVMNTFNIKAGLKMGENIVNFTPSKVGQFKFSCVMGMYTGSITVIANDTSPTPISSSSITPIPTKASSSPETTSPSPSPSITKSPAQTLAYKPSPSPTQTLSTQIVKIVYTLDSDIVPNNAVVNVNIPVRVEVAVKEDGSGCMSTILIPGLDDEPQFLEKGKTLVMEFTPQNKGLYQFTCAMGVPRGTLTVI